MMRNRINSMVEELEGGIQNMLKKTKEETFEQLYKDYTAQYPRLHERPEQRHMLEQMLKLYVHIEFDLWPTINQLFSTKITEYRRLMSLTLKIMQQWDRTMSKLGFTFTAQAYIAVDERKSFDPKAVVQLQERVGQLIEETKDNLEEAKIEEAAKKEEKPPEIAEKKRKKDEFAT